MKIQFTITGQHIEATVPSKVVADSKNYLEAAFFFVSNEWSGLQKTVVFSNQLGTYNVLLDEDKCMVPWECIIAGELKVSVFAGDRITTDVAKVKIFPSGYKLGETPRTPTPDVYAEILDRLQTIQAGTVSQADIEKAVSAYLKENPVETMTREEVLDIITTSEELSKKIGDMIMEFFGQHKDELKGDSGSKGDPGNDGEPGQDGAPGEKGDPGANGKDAVYDVVNLVGTDMSSGVSVQPGKCYLLGECGVVNVTFQVPDDDGIENTYVVKFTAGSDGEIPLFKYEGSDDYLSHGSSSEISAGTKCKAVFEWSDKFFFIMK